MSLTFEEFVHEVTSKKGKVIGKPVAWKNVNLSMKGEGTEFIFGENVKMDGVNITDYGGGNHIYVGNKAKLNGMIKIGKGCLLKIGDSFTSTAGLKLHLSEGKSMVIGNNCMFGIDVTIYNHDYHPIFDKKTGMRINYSRDVIIGDNVWLANKVTVLKGVSIGSGSVVGIGSVVSTNITDNSIAVGVPAKVVKTDILWDRSSFNTTHLDGISNISEV